MNHWNGSRLLRLTCSSYSRRFISSTGPGLSYSFFASQSSALRGKNPAEPPHALRVNPASSRYLSGKNRMIATISDFNASNLPKFRYLSAWFCPYAHRATIALEYHKHFGRIDYEWIEALGWKQQQEKYEDNEQAWYYHWKAEELVRVNPSALVPTLIPIDPTTQMPLEDQAIYESLVCIDYVDSVAAQSVERMGGSPACRLNPVADPYLAAKCRIWTDKVNRECCSPY
jgi:Glutathione S-transferase, N-terminal domain